MSLIKNLIRTIPDFPIEGIMFRDVTTLFDNAKGFQECIDRLTEPHKKTKIDKVIGLEARGFIIGGAIAKELKCGFIPIRKEGKLPSKTIAQDYELEYGKATLEIHEPRSVISLTGMLLVPAPQRTLPCSVLGSSSCW